MNVCWTLEARTIAVCQMHSPHWPAASATDTYVCTSPLEPEKLDSTFSGALEHDRGTDV